MYVRISRAKCQPGREADVKALMDNLKSRLHEAPGVQHWVSVLTSDGELVVMGFFPDKRTCERTEDVNERRWAQAADMFEGKPIVTRGDVLAFVSEGE